VLGLGVVEIFLEMAGAGYHPSRLEPAQGFQASESHELVLLDCGLYDMCECGMYVQLDFESAGNSLAHAKDRQISGDGWAASCEGKNLDGSGDQDRGCRYLWSRLRLGLRLR
jgi:hypothetical protein